MTITAKESSQQESQTEYCETRPYSAISEHSSVKGTPKHIRDWLMSLLPDSLVNHSALPERARPRTMIETSGLKRSMSFAEYDHESRSWRTHQACLLETTFDEYTETWPKAGMTLSGAAYPLPKQELRIAAIDGGAWPTPQARDATPRGAQAKRYTNPERSNGLPDAVAHFAARWPTPSATDHKGSGVTGDLRDRLDYAVERGATKTNTYSVPQSGGQLNPTWVEWLMGWPLGWTALEPLEMDKYQQWCEQHGICSATNQTGQDRG